MDLSSLQLVETNNSNIISSGAAVSGAQAIDLSVSDYFKYTLSGNVTFSITNTKSGTLNSFVLELINAGNYTIAWPSNVTFNGGTAFPVFTTGTTATIIFKTFDGISWDCTITNSNQSYSLSPKVTTPAITSPTNNGTGISLNPTLTSSAFSVSGLTHTASQWQISTSNTFATTLVDSGTDTTNKTSYSVSTALTISSVYYARIRHQGSNGTWSSWSTVVGFTTQAVAYYVDDVFSTYLYTGNGSTQTINNGVDLAGSGGMVWFKSRINTATHALVDTTRTTRYTLNTSTTASQLNQGADTVSMLSNGFMINSGYTEQNANYNYASWTFRKAPKFFDIVTWTGNNIGRQIPHNLGITPGLIIYKNLSTSSDWVVAGTGFSEVLELNTSDAVNTDTYKLFNGVGYVAPADDNFLNVGTASGGNTYNLNASGNNYIAYLFADDPSSKGIIRTGWGNNGNNSADQIINLGWEPQFVLTKNRSTGNWMIFDNMRGVPTGGNDSLLIANSTSAETNATNFIEFTSTGFIAKTGGFNSSLDSFIYMAIRRSNKPPTLGTQVYQPDRPSSSGTFTIDAGIPIDFSIAKGPTAGDSVYVGQRLTGPYALDTTNANGEYNLGWGFASNTSATIAGTGNYSAWISWNFKRAPGFFDVVCYTGNDTNVPGTDRAINHSLGVPPELAIVKLRDIAGEWGVGSSANWSRTLYLQGTNAYVGTSADSYRAFGIPTDTTFLIRNNSATNLNANAHNYVAYLFATLAGISKVGSYTGNGSSQDINCGFFSTARFILIKRTDATGDWYIWDSARGIVASNDPHLSLNTTAAEVTTDDSIDPYAYGFNVVQNAATNINVTNGTYIYLAIA